MMSMTIDEVKAALVRIDQRSARPADLVFMLFSDGHGRVRQSHHLFSTKDVLCSWTDVAGAEIALRAAVAPTKGEVLADCNSLAGMRIYCPPGADAIVARIRKYIEAQGDKT